MSGRVQVASDGSASRLASDGAGREQVVEIQRARLLSAMAAVTAEHGVAYATIGRVVARSGVSRRTFYEQFVDREDCFLAAFDLAVERIAAVVIPAYTRSPEWGERVRDGLFALLEFLDFEPDLARLAIVEALGAGPRALEHRGRCLEQVIAVIDLEGREASKREDPPPLMAEGVLGGVLSLIHSRLLERPHTPLVELLNPLVSMVVLPYLGPAVARRALGRSVPVARDGHVKAGMDALRDLEMRLTYRTVRVLLAIDAHSVGEAPPSNRQVADASGIHDQGQISKLLARLRDLGLIENATEPDLKGGTNAWRLTPRGVEVRGAISP